MFQSKIFTLILINMLFISQINIKILFDQIISICRVVFYLFFTAKKNWTFKIDKNKFIYWKWKRDGETEWESNGFNYIRALMKAMP